MSLRPWGLSAGGLGHEGGAGSVPAGSESRPEAAESQFCSERAVSPGRSDAFHPCGLNSAGSAPA